MENTIQIKTTRQNTLLFLVFLIFNNFLVFVSAQDSPRNESVRKVKSISKSTEREEPLADMVRTSAEVIKNFVSEKITSLTGRAKIEYQDLKVEADSISVDWNTGQIYARGKYVNNKLAEPVITVQGGKKYETDQFYYNFKSKKAIAYNSRTEESEGVIVAEKTKKISDSVFYFSGGRYTTDEYYLKKKDTVPDYFLRAPHLKLIKTRRKSQIITGPIQMYIGNVPTPIILPFAVLPFSEKRSAGLIVPSFGERESVGFFLNNLGYYQPIGQYFDLKILLDLYTKGSWTIRPQVGYKKKYTFGGNFSAELGTTIIGIKGLDNYSKSSTYRIAWTHSQDAKANPYFNFSASVNIVSSKFYNTTLNNTYIFNQNVLNTQQNSTVSITKRFLSLPMTLTSTASYSQNFSTGFTNLRLPQMNLSVNQFYLFKPRDGAVRQGLLENINVNTGLSFTNYVNSKQNELFTPKMWEAMQAGLQNRIGLASNATFAKYFTFSMSANINNVFTNKTLTRTYDASSGSVKNSFNKKIAGYSTFNTSASVQTTLYGNRSFGKNFFIQKIRHMVIPSVNFSYSPDFSLPAWGYYKYYEGANGVLTPYSVFEGGVYGAPNSGVVQSLGFNISNNIEMKVKSKTDSSGVKKVKVFESLNISANYNFAAPKYKWSLVNISGQTSLFKNKFNINSSLVLDPYTTVYDENGKGIRTEKIGQFAMQGFNVQLSFPLNNETFFPKKTDYAKKYKTRGSVMNEPYFFDSDNYSRFYQPWSLNVSANYSYTRGSLSKFGAKVASIGLTGNIKLTPFWNINGSTYFDVMTQKLGLTRLGFSLDQRSFAINFNWVPFGAYKVYDFFIGIKANILKDALKYRDRSFNRVNSSF
ncbi:MAG: LPS-assembly protein LptD [Bergeyella sp.]|nr:LPS-assembly protein LptD [Bergeyella sp.]